MTRTRWGLSLSILLVARLASAEVCESVRHSFELDPSPGTELDVGKCYDDHGDAEQARRWYRDAERRFTLAGNSDGERFAHERLDALDHREQATPAARPADDPRRGWRIALFTSVGVAVLGGGVWMWGQHEMSDATAKLCAGGAYPYDASCGPSSTPLTSEQVAQLNHQGFRGHDMAVLGGLTVGLAGAVAIVSAYQGYVRREPSHRDGVVIAPVVGRGTGGAVALWSW